MKNHFRKIIALTLSLLASQVALAQQEVKTIDGVKIVTNNVASPIVFKATSIEFDYDYGITFKNPNLRGSVSITPVQGPIEVGGSETTMPVVRYDTQVWNRAFLVGFGEMSNLEYENLRRVLEGLASQTSAQCPLNIVIDRDSLKIIDLQSCN